MNLLTEKFKEVLISVVPVVILVFMINVFLVPMDSGLLVRFFLGSFLIVIGLSFFLFGVDRGIAPVGGEVGEQVAKANKLWFVVVASLVLGFVISIAEPGLLIFGQQINFLSNGSIQTFQLIMVVSIGIALFLSLGFLRIIYNIPLYIVLTILYIIVLILAIFVDNTFLVIAFDASGATTGVLAVPFILALALGVSHLKRDSKAGEKDSFGTIAIVSVGAIIAVMILNLLGPTVNFIDDLGIEEIPEGSALSIFFSYVPDVFLETVMAIIPLLVIFIGFQLFMFKFKRRKFIRIFRGFVYSFLGLLLFLLGVNAGFMDVGRLIGEELAVMDNRMYIILVAFVLGIATILAEPAVHVLTNQIETVTSGYVSRLSVLISLSLGVGIAVLLSILRVFIEPLQIWHYLLPGYFIALSLMYIVPKIFVGIAFDAGGVATGPMTATFILAFVQGAANATEGADVILDGFGMIAMVALTPIITLQILGLLFKLKTRKEGV